MSFTRNLTFRTDSQTITSSLTIMLTFDAIAATPKLNQVAWRVLNFGGGGQAAEVTYAQNLLFASLEFQAGNLVTAVADQVLSLGQQTTLDAGAGGVGVVFTPPVTGTPQELIAINNTGQPQGIAIGYLDPSTQLPDVLLAWQNVGNTNAVQATYTPILKAYVTSNYQQTELITGEITSPVLLRQDLALLPINQTYTLSKNGDGSYSLTPDSFATPERRLIGYEPSPNDYHRGKPGFIGVHNQSRFDLWVKVSKSSNPSGKDDFYKVAPGKTESWARSRPEIVSVNSKGHGLVTDYFGAVGRILQIKG